MVTTLGVVVSPQVGSTIFPLLALMLKQAGISTVGNHVSPSQLLILRPSRSIASGFVRSRQERKRFIWIPSRNGLSWNFGKACSRISRMAMMAMMLKAKMMLRLVKGIRLAMDLPDLLVSARWMEGGLKAMVTPSEATITRAVVVPRKR